MYNLICELPDNREPWLIPVEQRRKMAAEAYREGKRLVLVLYHHADTSTFRYRCYNVQQATQTSDKWQSVYFFINEMDSIKKFLSRSSLLILCRVKWEHVMDDLLQYARSMNIPVLYDIDDMVCNLQYLRLVTNSLDVRFGSENDYDFWFSYFSRLEFMASQTDGFITTNDYLGEKLQARFNKPYRIIKNGLNREQLEISSVCASLKKYQKSKYPYTMGYFSGTPSHINDFKLICPELIQLLLDYPDMNLLVAGFMDFPREMQELIQEKRVRFKPLVDFMELQRLIAEVDVNIVPLVQNTFTNCKSELKFFEASVVDTVTVATPIYTYSSAIRNGETGFLCRVGDWYNCISNLYNNPDVGGEVTERAKEYCLNEYSGSAYLRQIEQTYDYFAH